MMTDGLKALLGDAHGLLALLIILGATVLVVLKIMPLDEWENFVKWIFTAFAGTHAIVSGVNALSARKASQPKKEPS